MKSLLKKFVGHVSHKTQLLTLHQENRLHPVWLFFGPEGVGKKHLALGLAQAFVCEKKTGCGECGPCLRIYNRQSESLLLIEPTGESIKVEDAHEVIRFLSLKSLGHSQVVIIDGVENLTTQAANTLLKSLEEPPANNFIFLISSNLSAVLPTLRSRSQILRFRPLSEKEWSASRGTHPEKVEEARQKTVDLLTAVVSGNYLNLEVEKCAKESTRENLCDVFNYCQRALRDVLNLRLGRSATLGQGFASIAEQLRGRNSLCILDLWNLSFECERDLERNVDSKLTLEKFYWGGKKVLENSSWVG
ncbi:MAG: DNA polymerase III subunit [Pseudomonadota bacterium]|nr:DNA polymerase III subunit [Pseudomonadota bacterium]